MTGGGMCLLFSSRQEWALAIVTMFWGATFLFIRMAMSECGPLFFVGLRFSIAALILFTLAAPILRDITRREIWGGSLLGLLVFLGFASQTIGLVDIAAAKSAFITAFYVPLVPVFEFLLMRHAPSLRSWIGVTMGFIGIVLLMDLDAIGGGLGKGELVTVFCAIAFALEIVVIGMVVPGTSPRRIVACELLVTALLSFACMPVTGEKLPEFSWFFVCIATGLGFTTALLQSVIAWAQKSVSPTRATIIYTGEPIWGGLFGYLAGERLSYVAIAGCCMIVMGILVSNKK